jgi:hypothetical protein
MRRMQFLVLVSGLPARQTPRITGKCEGKLFHPAKNCASVTQMPEAGSGEGFGRRPIML